MRILNINSKTNYNIAPQFKGLRAKPKTLSDIFTQQPNKFRCEANAISEITNIRPFELGGTQCRNSIPLKNFWDFFESDGHYIKGFSTNKDGYANSYLKAKTNVPLSTSFVHDCSVMYLFNKDTQTHALYHAHSKCSKETLKFIIDTLMPEGFTKGAIVPGDHLFFREHKRNMENMFKLMKDKNPNVLINVYNASTRYPEIVGYKGFMYEIPNKKVQEQRCRGEFEPWDFGQSSFKIANLQGFNTFDNIDICKNSEELLKLKKTFKDAKFPKETLAVLNNQVEKRLEVMQEIEAADDFGKYNLLLGKYSGKEFVQPMRYQKENLYINLLKEIYNLDDLRFFYQMVSKNLARMDRLATLLQEKKREILG